MKTVLHRLALVVICFESLSLCPAAKADEPVLIDLNLDSVKAGSLPPTDKFETTTVNHSIESMAITESNKLEVVNDAPGFPGKALRFIKNSPDPHSPRAIFVNHPGGLLKSGQIRFSWDSEIDSFESSDRFPGFEALLTFMLLDSAGKPFFNLSYLVDSTRSGGCFGSVEKGGKLGTWAIGTKQHVEVVVDLDAGTAVIKIDGTQVGAEQKIAFTDGLRVVQLGDGTGLAYYGSKFTATVAHFKMTTFLSAL